MADSSKLLVHWRAMAFRAQYGASKLTPEEISLIEPYFHRREQIDGVAGVRAAGRIAERGRERLGITVDITSDQLLEEVLAEYRSRGTFR